MSPPRDSSFKEASIHWEGASPEDAIKAAERMNEPKQQPLDEDLDQAKAFRLGEHVERSDPAP